MAPLTLREAYRHIIDTSAQSPVVIGIEPLLLEEPVLKLRVHLGASLFVDGFFNADTGKTSFALIKDGQRIFGADNTRGRAFNTRDLHRRMTRFGILVLTSA